MLSVKRLTDWMRREIHHLVRLHDSPHSIAGGTAVGVFFGFTPFLGLKTLLGIGVAWGFRCSRVAAAIGVALHDVIVPFMPVLLRFEYGVGYWLLSHPHHWPDHFKIEHLRIHEWLHWHAFVTLVWPTFIGSLFVGLPAAAVAFGVTLRIVRRAQARRQHADAAALGLEFDGK